MTNIIEHAKEIAELIKKYNDQDLYRRIVELREEILQLREDNLTLRDEVTSYKRTADISSRLRRDGNRYFLDDDQEKKQPYCLTCWDADRKLVSLILSQGHGGLNIQCAICRARGSR
jgi:hypothetical protein